MEDQERHGAARGENVLHAPDGLPGEFGTERKPRAPAAISTIAPSFLIAVMGRSVTVPGTKWAAASPGGTRPRGVATRR